MVAKSAPDKTARHFTQELPPTMRPASIEVTRNASRRTGREVFALLAGKKLPDGWSE